jgi:hypothetical protein
MSSAINDNRQAALRAGLEATEAAIRGGLTDNEIVDNLSYVLALALDHRLDKPGPGIPEPAASLLSRINQEAINVLADWSVGKTAGLKRLREFIVECDSGGSP